jgi:molybdopterin molybdotransferase
MINVQQAERIITRCMKSLGANRVPLEKALGCVLQENITADRDFPPFDKSLLDGIAIRKAAWQKGVRAFNVEGIQPAGKPAYQLKGKNGCTQIMTGAVLTKGADCVIPIEGIIIKNKTAYVDKNFSLTQANIRPQGSDCKKGHLLIKKGAVLGPAQIAVITAVGKSTVNIVKKPSVAVVSTGDEIVHLTQSAKPYHVRPSNAYFIKAALQQLFLERVNLFHARDNRRSLKKIIQTILKRYDILILSGGVSMGKFDLVPEILCALNVKVLFHNVRQKPGKPFWFGLTRDHKPVFALPGNPASTQACMYRYVIPYIQRTLGLPEQKEYAKLAKGFAPQTPFTFFLPIRIQSNQSGAWLANPVPTGGSGDIAGVGRSDGFMELPAGVKNVKPGFRGKIYRW